MRTLFVHERFGSYGGAEANISLTANELKRRGHTVGLLHGPHRGRTDIEWNELFAAHYSVGAKPERANVQAALWDFQPDIIYLHKMSDLEVLQGLAASGTPVIRMIHDHDLYCMRGCKYFYFSRKVCRRPFSPLCIFPCGGFLSRSGGLRFRWVSYMAKKRELRLNRHFQRLIVATQYMKDELLVNGFSSSRIQILPPVTHYSDPGLSSSFNARNLILYVGQIIRGKGVDVLLEALAQVTAPFTCLIFGDGNHRSYCEKLSRKLGLQDKVIFKGFVSQAELKAYYQECSAVVMSSVWPEPFGAAGLEGMRYGLPVVAFDAGGIREWLTDGYNGFLVPWMDRTTFAARVQHLLVHKDQAREMGERGRQMVAEEHDLNRYVELLDQTFHEVLTETREKAVV
ncbi:MAG TPA: glycosyltransferase family 4 protein [Verrucomicrobiae bacterium]|nr:glycosyltransferase family 4 protein [Verrucomicrobiae bacterium]